jgi:hypothetical protein
MIRVFNSINIKMNYIAMDIRSLRKFIEIKELSTVGFLSEQRKILSEK